MTDYQIILLKLLKASLFNSTYALPASVNWSALFQEAKDQTVVGLVEPVVKQFAEELEIPNLDQWIESSNALRAYFVRCFHAQKELVKLFEENEIPIVIVKGYAAAVYYPVKCIRTMGDIDFLIPVERYEEGQVLLENFGYQKQYGFDSEDSRHIGYEKNNVVFEMHKSMSSFGVEIDDVINNGIINKHVGSIAGVTFPILPPLENGLILLIHIRQHLLEEKNSLGLRQIIDWMMYVNRYAGNEINGVVWDNLFLELIKSYGIDTLAITLTYMCKEWLGLPTFPLWCERANRNTAEELLELILASGNFGIKNDNNKRNARNVKELIVLYGRDNIFKRLQSHGIANWEAAQRYRILRSFAWLYQFFRVIGLGVKELFLSKNCLRQIKDGYNKSDLLKRLGV